jgi:membrane protein YqaA with SNARE-associated domain
VASARPICDSCLECSFHSFASFSAGGGFVLAALDSSVFFFVPFANDTLIVYLAARRRELFWFYPLVATAGSVVGAWFTYWIGKRGGEAGLPLLVSPRRLDMLKQRVKNAGAATMAMAALLPPPFPLSPFILTCGALEVSLPRFFTVFAAMRIVRFESEALLARRYGQGILRSFESEQFRLIIMCFAAVAIVATVASTVVLWPRTRRRST